MVLTITIVTLGALGGLLKSLMEQKGKVALPKLEITKDDTYIHFGFILNLVLGATVAMITASDPAGAIAAGISSAFTIEKLIEYSPIVKP